MIQNIVLCKAIAVSVVQRFPNTDYPTPDHCHDEGLTEEQLEDVHDFALDEDIIDDLKMTHKWVKERYS